MALAGTESTGPKEAESGAEALAAVHAQIVAVEAIIAKMCAIGDPVMEEAIAAKRAGLQRLQEEKERVLAEMRAAKPLHLQCRRAAQTRDTLVRRHLGLLADAQALEALAAARRTAAAEVAAQVRSAEAELLRLRPRCRRNRRRGQQPCQVLRPRHRRLCPRQRCNRRSPF